MNDQSDSSPTTESERYLSRLCRRSFLRLWSWPNVFRDERLNGTISKEICDLLVVFDKHIIIFSDKDCEFPNTGHLERDWSRWFRKAVQNSARQVWGAERWIRQHPDRIFLDKYCKKPFPFPLPPPQDLMIHRVLVAHGSADRGKECHGGSGSLMICPDMVGDDHSDPSRDNFRPFAVGRLSGSKGFIHVLDDFSLDVLVQTLDTAPDLIRYLQQRAELILSNKLFFAPGEEDLLAYYLGYANEQGQHYFRVPEGHKLFVAEGSWNYFQNHAERHAQIEADKISYAWDILIETFSKHLLEGTQYYHRTPEGSHQEVGIRFLAREGRWRRRMLSQALIGAMKAGAHHGKLIRLVPPIEHGDPHYVFLTLQHQNNRSHDEYRRGRGNVLYACCLVARLLHPNAQHVVGIATEPFTSDPARSEDLMYFNGKWWNEELAEEAARLRELYGILLNPTIRVMNEPEYPLKRNLEMKKRRNQNQPCQCGSGKKYKKCHGKVE